MRGFGQIAALCEIARPDIGVITTIAPAHLELVGSLEGVARAKAELLEALPSGGAAVLPAALARARPVRRPAVSPFAASPATPRSSTGSRLDDGARLTRRCARPPRRARAERDRARHHADNALAALLAYDALGLPLDDAHVGAGSVELSRWRGEELPLPGRRPADQRRLEREPALDARRDRPSRRRRGRAATTVAVLGDMAELGPDGPALPPRDRRACRATAGVDGLLAVGPLAAGYVEGAGFGEAVPDVDAAREALARLVEPGECVLIKASRAMGLEALAEHLTRIHA